MDRTSGLAFFSIIPEEHWKGDQGLRDYLTEKGLISLCWVGVGVLEVRLDLMWVSLTLP